MPNDLKFWYTLGRLVGFLVYGLLVAGFCYVIFK